MNSIKNCDFAIEKLSISLDYAVKRIQKDSTGRSSIGPLASILIIPFYLYVKNQITLQIYIIFGVLLLITMLLSFVKIIISRRMLNIHNYQNQQLVLTNKGIEIPLLAIAWFRNINIIYFLKKLNYVHLEWKDIQYWQVVLGKNGNYYYIFINNKLLKNIILPIENFSNDQQTSILEFAQRFLARPILF